MIMGALVAARNLTGSRPPLTSRCQLLSGGANRLQGPHSKICLRCPSCCHISVAPCPDRIQITSSYMCRSGFSAPPGGISARYIPVRSEEHTSELQSQSNLVCRLLLEQKKPS